MKLDYKSKKWDEEMKKIQDYKKYCGEGYLSNVNAVINKFSKTNDYAWLYGCLDLNYQEICYMYLQENDYKKVLENTYLSAKSMITFKQINEKGLKTQFVSKNEKLLEVEYAICKMIAIDCVESILDNCQESIIGNLYMGNIEKAQKLVEQIPDGCLKEEDVYYRTPFFIKILYQAIIDKDEEKFNNELCKRVKKYRKNMVGYSTIIDYTSIALIKVANKLGIQSNLHIVEMPEFFFEPINTDEIMKQELPFQEETNVLLV